MKKPCISCKGRKCEKQELFCTRYEKYVMAAAGKTIDALVRGMDDNVG